jgi:NADPH:quinone reductase-like Zn-dependent oxidoreductase
VKPLPTVPGFEGSGVVVETGKSAKDMINKKVCAFVQTKVDGTWATYFVARKKDLIILKEAMDMDQAACFTVNPFTAYALMEIALLRESKAIIQNAAGAQLASFVRDMAKEHAMEVINIVRKTETANQLKQQGVKHVLCQADENFEEKLTSLSLQLQATTAFDAVGGELTGQMLNALTGDSELVVYGGLSNKPASGIGLKGVIFNNKIMSGFNLIDWKKELDEGAYERISDILQDKLIKGVYKTHIQQAVGLDQIVQGLKTYLGHMSDGKILIKP